jgi:hypothetical protein
MSHATKGNPFSEPPAMMSELKISRWLKTARPIAAQLRATLYEPRRRSPKPYSPDLGRRIMFSKNDDSPVGRFWFVESNLFEKDAVLFCFSWFFMVFFGHTPEARTATFDKEWLSFDLFLYILLLSVITINE